MSKKVNHHKHAMKHLEKAAHHHNMASKALEKINDLKSELKKHEKSDAKIHKELKHRGRPKKA